MTIQKRLQLYKKICDYLTTPKVMSDGSLRKPTLWETAVKFDKSVGQIHRIKKKLLGLDKDIPQRNGGSYEHQTV